MESPVKMETISLGGDNIQVPASLIEDVSSTNFMKSVIVHTSYFNKYSATHLS